MLTSSHGKSRVLTRAGFGVHGGGQPWIPAFFARPCTTTSSHSPHGCCVSPLQGGAWAGGVKSPEPVEICAENLKKPETLDACPGCTKLAAGEMMKTHLFPQESHTVAPRGRG